MKRPFFLHASIVVAFAFGASTPTPLYPTYQDVSGFSTATATAIFAVYALAVLATFLVLGSLSDHVGRRPVLLAGLALHAVAMALFALANGVGMLLAARILQGLATGPTVAAAGAGMLDVDRERGTLVNGFAPTLGTATGSLVAGLLVAHLPAPRRLVFVLVAAVHVLQLGAVLRMPESAKPLPGALASLRPALAVPPRLRGPFLPAIPCLVGAWALPGFYGALGPALVRVVAGSTSSALAGLALFMLAAGAVLAALFLRALDTRRLIRLGAVLLAGGVGVVLLAVRARAPVAFFLGSALAGAGFGASFQGALRSVLGLAAPHERAGVLSVVYLVCYLATGLLALLAGLLVVHGGGLEVTARRFGIGVIALEALALASSLGRRAR